MRLKRMTMAAMAVAVLALGGLAATPTAAQTPAQQCVARCTATFQQCQRGGGGDACTGRWQQCRRACATPAQARPAPRPAAQQPQQQSAPRRR
jgi:hypothetical protein